MICRCRQFVCRECKGNPCECKVEWKQIEFKKGKARMTTKSQSRLLAEQAAKETDLGSYTRALARAARAEIDERYEEEED